MNGSSKSLKNRIERTGLGRLADHFHFHFGSKIPTQDIAEQDNNVRAMITAHFYLCDIARSIPGESELGNPDSFEWCPGFKTAWESYHGGSNSVDYAVNDIINDPLLSIVDYIEGLEGVAKYGALLTIALTQRPTPDRLSSASEYAKRAAAILDEQLDQIKLLDDMNRVRIDILGLLHDHDYRTFVDLPVMVETG